MTTATLLLEAPVYDSDDHSATPDPTMVPAPIAITRL
jgi:hypothetical protein